MTPCPGCGHDPHPVGLCIAQVHPCCSCNEDDGSIFGTEPAYYLRYKREIPEGVKFASIRYPWKRNVSREQIENMHAAMPDPSRFEIVEVPESA